MAVRTVAVSVLSLVLWQASTYAQETSLEPRGPKRTELRGPTVCVPMEDWGGRPVVLATINGKGPFKLLIDTGAMIGAVLNDDLVKKLGLPETSKTPASGAVGEDDLIELATITIGGAEFSGVSAIRDGFGSMPGGPEMPKGILGLPLFEDCLLTLDYPRRKVVFESAELPPPDGETIAYSPDRQRDFGVTIELSVAGTAVKAHVDTGSPGFVALLTEMQDKLPLAEKPRVVGRARTPDGEAEIRSATLDGVVKIGKHEFDRPRLNFNDLGPMVRYGCGNVGSRLLRDFAVTVDQKNRRLRLHRPATGSGHDGTATVRERQEEPRP